MDWAQWFRILPLMDDQTLRSRPLALSASTEAQVYFLFALAMALTVFGVALGMRFATQILTSGWFFLMVIAELAIILTSRWWVARSPLNIVLFALFPTLTGITITPYLMAVLAQYVNGGSILLNALGATACMAAAAAVFARTTKFDLSVMGRTLLFALLGLIFLGLLQIFFPALRTTQFELMITGGGVLIFAAFTAYDIQRIQDMSRMGASPFLLGLSLYLDIFNLFLYVLRFMVAVSGQRR